MSIRKNNNKVIWKKKSDFQCRSFYLQRYSLSTRMFETIRVYQGPILSPGSFVRDAITGYHDTTVRMNTNFEHMYYKIALATGEGDPYCEPIILFFQSYRAFCDHLHHPFDQSVNDDWFAKYNHWKKILGVEEEGEEEKAGGGSTTNFVNASKIRNEEELWECHRGGVNFN